MDQKTKDELESLGLDDLTECWRCHALHFDSDHRCPESGAIRRASMDLTRALANLRRPER